MPLCYVRWQDSPTFNQLLKHLKRRFPNIEKDLEEIWVAIARDYRNANRAESIPRFGDTVFKYRAKCSDMQRGSRGGYRIIGYYHKEKNTLYPILMYHKSDQDDVDERTVAGAVTELLAILSISK